MRDATTWHGQQMHWRPLLQHTLGAWAGAQLLGMLKESAARQRVRVLKSGLKCKVRRSRLHLVIEEPQQGRCAQRNADTRAFAHGARSAFTSPDPVFIFYF